MKLFFTLWGASLRSRMQYKGNFLFSSFTYGLIMAVDFLMLAAILLRFDDVMGWTIYEVGYLYGIASASMSLYRLLAPEIHEFERYMVEGEFDSLLIRPVPPLTLLLTRNLELSRIGGVVQGIAILVLSLHGLAATTHWLPALLYLPVAFISGLIISFALGLITATLAFWTQRIKDFQAFTLYAPNNAASYPMSIYPGWLKWILFTVLPVAFIAYVPALYLLDKGGTWHNLWVSPAVAGVFLWISLRFWRFGIRYYHSTGS
ncbi:ABC transporter permease [Desmospora activa]|uniref:ABC-2 type transport system permease protein n=1 Tax=Desmospora activa DSM 45169 TaxID=1121389 RepID=A0A2T4Z0K3_9BACL|nr:ABC-2 family transporter protein [Desmospora activa]PTM53277.1 ABC-2 type transport system permease protein [Desmospora activa DSM 45169]